MLCSPKKPVTVRQVWADNLVQEFTLIQHLLPNYPFIAMDTEFPGAIFQPNYVRPKLSINPDFPGVIFQTHVKVHHSKVHPSLNYSVMKANVDALKLIQVGLTLSDADGNLPDLDTDVSYIWEFNFRDFNVDRDVHNAESINLLREQGIDFEKNRVLGIDSRVFAMMLVRFHLVCNRRQTINWVTFHGTYDFGYLIKILTQRNLPPNLSMFMSLVKFYFGGAVFDIKHVMKYCDGLYGGLENVAKSLVVDRVAGKSHQAGSDSLLTMHAFMKLKGLYFHGEEEELDQFKSVLNGFEIY